MFKRYWKLLRNRDLSPSWHEKTRTNKRHSFFVYWSFKTCIYSETRSFSYNNINLITHLEFLQKRLEIRIMHNTSSISKYGNLLRWIWDRNRGLSTRLKNLYPIDPFIMGSRNLHTNYKTKPFLEDHQKRCVKTPANSRRQRHSTVTSTSPLTVIVTLCWKAAIFW